MLFLVLLVSVRTVHLQVVVCILFYVLPNTCIHKYPVLILHTVIPAFFGTLDCGHIIQYFFRGNRILPVDFGEGVWKFLLQITERVVLKNEDSVVIGMD
jgi:hypothetical protein